MRSVYARILLASVGTVVLALAAFLGIFFTYSSRTRQRLIHAFGDVLTDDAVDAYSRGGAPAAAAYLARL